MCGESTNVVDTREPLLLADRWALFFLFVAVIPYGRPYCSYEIRWPVITCKVIITLSVLYNSRVALDSGIDRSKPLDIISEAIVKNNVTNNNIKSQQNITLPILFSARFFFFFFFVYPPRVGVFPFIPYIMQNQNNKSCVMCIIISACNRRFFYFFSLHHELYAKDKTRVVLSFERSQNSKMWERKQGTWWRI